MDLPIVFISIAKMQRFGFFVLEDLPVPSRSMAPEHHRQNQTRETIPSSATALLSTSPLCVMRKDEMIEDELCLS